MNEIKLLGVTLDLFKQSHARGWRSMLRTEQLEELLDELAEDFPTRSDRELAELAGDLIAEEYPEFDTVSVYYHAHTGKLCGHVVKTDHIVADAKAATLTVSHIGWSIRSLQASAAACDPTVRKWSIILMPQNCTLGQVLLRKVYPETQTNQADS